MAKERRDDVDVQNGIDTWLRRAGLPTTHALQGAFAPLCCRVDRSVWASCVSGVLQISDWRSLVRLTV